MKHSCTMCTSKSMKINMMFHKTFNKQIISHEIRNSLKIVLLKLLLKKIIDMRLVIWQNPISFNKMNTFTAYHPICTS